MLCLFSCAGSHHTARQTGWFKVPRSQRETTIQIRSSEEGSVILDTIYNHTVQLRRGVRN